MRDATAKFSNYSWHQCDEQFRVRQALKVENWGRVNSDLWLCIMPISASSVVLHMVHAGTSTAKDFVIFSVAAIDTYVICLAVHFIV